MDYYNYYEDKMEEKAMVHNKKIKFGKASFIIIGLLAVSLVLNILFRAQLTKVTEAKNTEILKTEKAIAEKLQVLKEFDATKNDLQNLTIQKNALDQLIALKTKALENSEKQNHVLAKQNADIPVLKSELAKLTSERETLHKQIAELERDNKMAKASLNNLEDYYSSLPENIKEKVEKAQQLKAYNITVTPLKLRASGKQIPTVKARKTARIGVTFDLAENVFASPGEKHITAYLKSKDPIITYKLGFKPEIIGIQTVSYNNTDTTVKINIDSKHKLGKGSYTIELLADNIPCGTKNFDLK